jgi:hypothetical protein
LLILVLIYSCAYTDDIDEGNTKKQHKVYNFNKIVKGTKFDSPSKQTIEDNDSDDSSDDEKEAEEDEKALMNDSALYYQNNAKQDLFDQPSPLERVFNKVEEAKKEEKPIIHIAKIEEEHELSISPKKKQRSHNLEEVETRFEPTRTLPRPERAMRGNSVEYTPRNSLQTVSPEKLADVGKKKSSRNIESQTKRESKKVLRVSHSVSDLPKDYQFSLR